jgi:nicotinamide mononucleotide transporter
MDASTLTEQLWSQDWIEWLGLVTGILYVVLAAYEKPSCWIYGIISCAAIGWKSLVDYKLIADGVLQVFYIIIGIIGLYQWVSGRIDNRPKAIVTSPVMQHAIMVSVCLLASIPLSWVLIKFAGARYGYPDTALMLLSIYATLLLVRKDLHTWWYWIVIDAAYVVLYLKTGALLFAILFLLYAVVSVWGYMKWKKNFAHYPV